VKAVGLYSHDRTLFPLLSSALGDEFRFHLESTRSGLDGLLEQGSCRVVLLDLRSTYEDVEEFAECAGRLIDSGVTVIVLADDGQRMRANQLLKTGAFGYCRRPPSVRELRLMLRKACEASSDVRPCGDSQVDGSSTSDRYHMVGTSEPMQEVRRLIERVADIDASILIVGESGTGKELIAHAIHNSGSRARRPFMAVACGAIPETLIEAELFGHEKGAFTGSVGTREGFLEKVGDGTLFLDEIGELSPYTQIKLLRVLQEREFSRLGSNRLIPLRARLIFATHRNLEQMVAEGKFRQDLYFRINVMKIEAPPLRDRDEDIAAIANHFLQIYARSFHKPKMIIAADAMDVLNDHSWPGNVRELENVIQQSIIMSAGNVVQVGDLPRKIREEMAPPAEIEEPFSSGSFERQLREYKVRLATTALRDNNGNKTLAARRLNISRAYLHRLIRVTPPALVTVSGEAPEGETLHQYA
jgi:DNA-binding NtrC family response regulator